MKEKDRNDSGLLINAYDFLRYSKMKNRINISDMDYKISKLGTFYNKEMSFNKISAYDLSRTLKYA